MKTIFIVIFTLFLIGCSSTSAQPTSAEVTPEPQFQFNTQIFDVKIGETIRGEIIVVEDTIVLCRLIDYKLDVIEEGTEEDCEKYYDDIMKGRMRFEDGYWKYR